MRRYEWVRQAYGARKSLEAMAGKTMGAAGVRWEGVRAGEYGGARAYGRTGYGVTGKARAQDSGSKASVRMMNAGYGRRAYGGEYGWLRLVGFDGRVKVRATGESHDGGLRTAGRG